MLISFQNDLGVSDFVVVVAKFGQFEDLVRALFVIGDIIGDFRSHDGITGLEVRITDAIRKTHATNSDACAGMTRRAFLCHIS